MENIVHMINKPVADLSDRELFMLYVWVRTQSYCEFYYKGTQKVDNTNLIPMTGPLEVKYRCTFLDNWLKLNIIQHIQTMHHDFLQSINDAMNSKNDVSGFPTLFDQLEDIQRYTNTQIEMINAMMGVVSNPETVLSDKKEILLEDARKRYSDLLDKTKARVITVRDGGSCLEAFHNAGILYDMLTEDYRNDYRLYLEPLRSMPTPDAIQLRLSMYGHYLKGHKQAIEKALGLQEDVQARTTEAREKPFRLGD
jgi:hypothetical protein